MVATRTYRQVPGQSKLRQRSPNGEVLLANLNVVVVDDDADTRRLVKLILAGAGATVAEAQSADAAFDAVQRRRCDLVISDINMPGDDGYALMRRIRTLALDRGGSIPSIALTGRSEPNDRKEALRAGFTAHLGKPVSASELIDTARAVTGSPKSR